MARHHSTRAPAATSHHSNTSKKLSPSQIETRYTSNTEVVFVDSTLPPCIKNRSTSRAIKKEKRKRLLTDNGLSHSGQRVENELIFLKRQIAAQTKLIESHRSALGQLQSQLTCQICLDMLNKPYAIVPCGHVSCLHCLQNWFRAPQLPDDQVMPRAKTCPHCRVVVKVPPVALYILRSAVSIVTSTLDSAPKQESSHLADGLANADPWGDLFPSVTLRLEGQPIVDHEDGGVSRCEDCLFEIWGGCCVGCGRWYAVPAADDSADDEDRSQAETDEGSYEGSFIDDQDAPFPQMLFDIGAHFNPSSPISISDDEDEAQDSYEVDGIGEEEAEIPSRRRRVIRARLQSPSSEDEMSDASIASSGSRIVQDDIVEEDQSHSSNDSREISGSDGDAGYSEEDEGLYQ